jgi:hypothetical protein
VVDRVVDRVIVIDRVVDRVIVIDRVVDRVVVFITTVPILDRDDCRANPNIIDVIYVKPLTS